MTAVRSSDRAPNKSDQAISYYKLVDELEPHFAAVQMVGIAPFCGATLAEYGNPDAVPILDGTLVPKGERVEWYVAISGSEKAPRGFALVQAKAPAAEAHKQDGKSEARQEVKKVDDSEARKRFTEIEQKNADLRRRVDDLVQKEKAATSNVAQLVAELEKTRSAARHGASSEEARLKERIADLEKTLLGAPSRPEESGELAALRREIEELRSLRKTLESARDEKADEARRLIDKVSRLEAALETAQRAPLGEGGDERVHQLEIENQKLREREDQARTEAWKHMKARSDAEAQAAEVREDTVRKLKDARKLASVDLMRAMEEATKKSVALKEDLQRTLAENKDLKQKLQAAQAAIAEAGRGSGSELLLATAERRIETLLGTVRDLERDVDDAEQRLSEERQRPTSAVDDSDALLDALRRVAELQAELARKDLQLERSAQAAAHERARAERMIADERRALSLRNEAKARAADAEARAQQLMAQISALEGALAEAQDGEEARDT